MESVIGFLVRSLGYLLFHLLFHFTGKAALPLLTFGWWHAKPLTDTKNEVGWHGFRRRRDGTMLVGETPAMLLGLVIWVFLGVGLLTAVT